MTLSKLEKQTLARLQKKERRFKVSTRSVNDVADLLEEGVPPYKVAELTGASNAFVSRVRGYMAGEVINRSFGRRAMAILDKRSGEKQAELALVPDPVPEPLQEAEGWVGVDVVKVDRILALVENIARDLGIEA